MTKLKNSKCDITQKLKMCQNSKNQNVTKLKTSNVAKLKKTQILTNLISLNYKKEKTHKLKLRENFCLSSSCYKTQKLNNKKNSKT